MDDLYKWLRLEIAQAHLTEFGGTWEGGWQAALETVVSMIPGFPDPPPSTPEGKTGLANVEAWAMWKLAMNSWSSRQTSSANPLP